MGLAIALLLSLEQGIPTETLVRKGTEYLKSQVAGLREDREFVLWTFVYVGTPKRDPVLQGLLQDLLAKPPESTTTAALQAMILEALDPLEYRARIAYCAQFLVDNQSADGRWDAGRPVDPPELPPAPPQPLPPKRRDFDLATPRPVLGKVPIVRKREGSKTGDSVLSRWAAWGLLACHQAGMIPPQELSEKAAAAWRIGDHDPADLISSLSFHLSLLRRDWKKDPDVLKAVERLADPARATDPRSLFRVKRAMLHFGKERLGEREWWPEGVRILAAAQFPDGRWGGIEETCSAVYFLHTPRIQWPRIVDQRK